MKMTLIEVKLSKINSCKRERDTCERKGVPKAIIEKTHQNKRMNVIIVRENSNERAHQLLTWVENFIDTILMDYDMLVQACIK